jgi:SAM-dependent MidA family methyltransferase
MALSEIIKEKIRQNGPLSFCDFMEMCLYYPRLGYYTSLQDRIGYKGDYYTSPYLTSIFGEMIGKQLEEMWQLMGREKFSIVEYGAGSGALCHSILEHLKNNQELYDQMDYYIIERNELLLTESEKVSYHDRIQDLPPITGCILSNELVDNFSIHQVVMEEELMEVFVDFKNTFLEVLRPASEELKNYLEELNIHLEKGFHSEINLQAINWMKEIAQSLEKGFLLTIDYGFPSFELYSNRRKTGTLMCYHKHTINNCPYINIGEQDITAHVNFSALRFWGLKNGLKYGGFTDQTHFLLSLGLADHLRKMEQAENSNFINNKENSLLINSLLMDMGTRLKVLLQYKGVDQPTLSGLRFPLPIV